MSFFHDVGILLCKTVTSTMSSQKLIRNFCCTKYDTHFLLAGWSPLVWRFGHLQNRVCLFCRLWSATSSRPWACASAFNTNLAPRMTMFIANLQFGCGVWTMPMHNPWAICMATMSLRFWVEKGGRKHRKNICVCFSRIVS